MPEHVFALGALAGVPVAAAPQDQPAATFGQARYDVGTAKNTYGTGNFLLRIGDRAEGISAACARNYVRVAILNLIRRTW